MALVLAGSEGAMSGAQTYEKSEVLVQGSEPMEYVVAYAKIVESKDNGINLEGVFFGGFGATLEEADEIARKCVNSIRGGTIIPKVMPIDGKCQVIDALYDATDNFEKIADQMVEAHKTIQRTQARKKK